MPRDEVKPGRLAGHDEALESLFGALLAESIDEALIADATAEGVAVSEPPIAAATTSDSEPVVAPDADERVSTCRDDAANPVPDYAPVVDEGSAVDERAFVSNFTSAERQASATMTSAYPSIAVQAPTRFDPGTDLPIIDDFRLSEPDAAPSSADDREADTENAQLPLNDVDQQPLTTQTGRLARATTDRPGWTESAFRVLLFRVGEFRFALPLVQAQRVSLMPRRLTRVPSQPAWQLGVVRYRKQTVVISELGGLLGITARCRDPRYLLAIGDGSLAMACDVIDEAILVEPQQVRWRDERPGPAWLMGLLIEQMCGLLDARAIEKKIGHG